MIKRALILNFIIAFLAVGVMMYIYHDGKQLFSHSQSTTQIGGNFTLTNQDGKKIDSRNYKYKLVLFGFSHCSDICPTELANISSALYKLNSQDITVFFISIDPQRDTVERLREFHKDFDPDIQMLTGTNEQIAKVAKKFGVFYSKNSTDNKKYIMEHSDIIYLLDKNSNYLTHFDYNTPVYDIVAQLKKYVK